MITYNLTHYVNSEAFIALYKQSLTVFFFNDVRDIMHKTPNPIAIGSGYLGEFLEIQEYKSATLI